MDVIAFDVRGWMGGELKAVPGSGALRYCVRVDLPT
jgi:hypothetical protein